MHLAEQTDDPNGQSKDESWTFTDARNSPSEQEVEQRTKDVDRPHGLKLDSNGLPLVPQPSRFKDDPLVSLS